MEKGEAVGDAPVLYEFAIIEMANVYNSNLNRFF